MSDDLVKRICQDWVKAGCSDDCFWEGWPECPTPEDSLTPRMVIDRIEELEAKLATARRDALEKALAANERARKATIYSRRVDVVAGIRMGHDRAEEAIRALITQEQEPTT